MAWGPRRHVVVQEVRQQGRAPSHDRSLLEAGTPERQIRRSPVPVDKRRHERDLAREQRNGEVVAADEDEAVVEPGDLDERR